MNKIKTFIVDDSAVVRQVMTAALNADPEIEVIGAALDPLFAWEHMKRQWPDVIVLDIEMPRMDGLTFLRKIMSERPTPVIICSTLTEAGAAPTLEALNAGAVEVLAKSRLGVRGAMEELGPSLVATVRAAAKANIHAIARIAKKSPTVKVPVVPPTPERHTADAVLPKANPQHNSIIPHTERIVAIGCSTGGTQALEVLLSELPKTAPAIVIVQHMPEKFTAPFAARLDERCEITVKEAADGDAIIQGQALIAPGGRHLMIRRQAERYFAEVRDGPPVNRHRPSVDVLFRSVARGAGKNAQGVLLTGMGDDGASGLLEMRQVGCPTIAESEETCVVYGMPREAVRRGAAARVLPLTQVAKAILGVG